MKDKVRFSVLITLPWKTFEMVTPRLFALSVDFKGVNIVVGMDRLPLSGDVNCLYWRPSASHVSMITHYVFLELICIFLWMDDPVYRAIISAYVDNGFGRWWPIIDIRKRRGPRTCCPYKILFQSSIKLNLKHLKKILVIHVVTNYLVIVI